MWSAAGYVTAWLSIGGLMVLLCAVLIVVGALLREDRRQCAVRDAMVETPP